MLVRGAALPLAGADGAGHVARIAEAARWWTPGDEGWWDMQ